MQRLRVGAEVRARARRARAGDPERAPELAPVETEQEPRRRRGAEHARRRGRVPAALVVRPAEHLADAAPRPRSPRRTRAGGRRPTRSPTSAAANAAGRSGTVGCPFIAQLTSSKSSACAAAPFASAASPAGTRCPVPQSVAASAPPCARAHSRTRADTGSSRPAIAQASPSRMAVRATARDAGGIASARRSKDELGDARGLAHGLRLRHTPAKRWISFAHASGCSCMIRCPQRSIGTTCALFTFLAQISAYDGAMKRSCAPHRTSVGARDAPEPPLEARAPGSGRGTSPRCGSRARARSAARPAPRCGRPCR